MSKLHQCFLLNRKNILILLCFLFLITICLLVFSNIYISKDVLKLYSSDFYKDYINKVSLTLEVVAIIEAVLFVMMFNNKVNSDYKNLLVVTYKAKKQYIFSKLFFTVEINFLFISIIAFIALIIFKCMPYYKFDKTFINYYIDVVFVNLLYTLWSNLIAVVFKNEFCTITVTLFYVVSKYLSNLKGFKIFCYFFPTISDIGLIYPRFWLGFLTVFLLILSVYVFVEN